MDILDVRNLQLSYQAIYDQTLCESMEELGIIGEARDGYGDDTKFKQDTDADSFRPGKDVPKVKKYGRISRYSPMGGQRSRTASEVTKTVGEDEGAPRAVKMYREKPKGKMVKRDGKWVKEALDYYDMILTHLLDEGYADDIDSAEAIMVNMSEEWVGEIVEGYKKLPLGKMIKQAARKGEAALFLDNEQEARLKRDINKMSRVADRHSMIKGKGRIRGEGQAELNRRRGQG